MGYFAEIRQHLRPLASATIGTSVGIMLIGYITSIMAPFLIEEFGWARSEFALIGLVSFAGLIFIPLAGFLTDRFGVRRVAAIGVYGLPLVFLLATTMTGDFAQFLGIAVLQIAFGAMTSTVVFTRIVAERFHAARGLALTIVTCGPAIVGGAGVPLLNAVVEDHGWRAGYYALAAFVALVGSIALLLIPVRSARQTNLEGRQPRRARTDYRLIFSSRTFWIIAIGMLLCNVYATLQSSQLKLLVMDNGLNSTLAATMLSVYAAGTIMGRITCGVALDYLPSHLVSAVSLGVPCLGFLLLASPFDQLAVIGLAVLLMGFSHGAEGDIIAYLVAEWFSVELYSTALGLISGIITLSAALGAVLLSATLVGGAGYSLFLILISISIFVGSLLFLLLGNGAERVELTGART